MIPRYIFAFISCHFNVTAVFFGSTDFRPLLLFDCIACIECIYGVQPASEQVQQCSAVSMEMLKLDQRPIVSLIKGRECFLEFVCAWYRYSWWLQWGSSLSVSLFRTLRVGETPDAQCISSCHCFTSSISPVCGSNGVTYLSACFAGCTQTGSTQTTSSISQVFYPETVM